MKKTTLFLFTFFCISFSFSQKKLTKQQLDSLPSTIKNQFTKTYHLGKNWHEYKMINKQGFLNLQKSILDSVGLLKKNIFDKDLVITKKQISIDSLQSEIKSIHVNLNDAITKEDSISLLGFNLNKNTYNSIVWGIIALLTLGIAFFVYKYKSNISVTKESKTSLTELEEEFNIYRKKTIEKEQKLRRQLHDEMNKNKGA